MKPMPMPPPADRGEYLLTVEGVTAKVCIGKTKLMEMVKAGEFPMPKLIGSRHRWRGRDVDSWIAETFTSLKQDIHGTSAVMQPKEKQGNGKHRGSSDSHTEDRSGATGVEARW